MASFLDILGSGVIAGGDFAKEREQEKKQKEKIMREQEQKRMDMLVKFMSQATTPQAKQQLLQQFQGGGDMIGAYSNILEQQAQEQQIQERTQRGIDQFGARNQGGKLSDFGTGDAQLPDRAITDDELGSLATAGSQGRGLDALMGMRGKLQNEVQDAEAKKIADAKAEQQSFIDGLGNSIDELRSQRVIAKQRFGEKSDAIRAIDQRMDAGFGMPEPPDSGEASEQAQNAFQDAIKSLAKGERVAPNVKAEYEALYGDMSPQQQKIFDNVAKETILRGVDIQATQAVRAQRAGDIVRMANRLEKMIDNPKLQESMGRFSGNYAQFLRWTQGGSEPEIEEFLTTLGMATDELSRLQSGAALTETEQEFYSSLLGGLTTNPAAMKVRLPTVRRRFLQVQKEAYLPALLKKFGANSSAIDDAMSLLVPDSQSTATYDPQTGWQ